MEYPESKKYKTLPYPTPCHAYVWGRDFEIRDQHNGLIVKFVVLKGDIHYIRNMKPLTEVVAALMSGTHWIEHSETDNTWNLAGFGVEDDPIGVGQLPPSVTVVSAKSQEQQNSQKSQPTFMNSGSEPSGLILPNQPIPKKQAPNFEGQVGGQKDAVVLQHVRSKGYPETGPVKEGRVSTKAEREEITDKLDKKYGKYFNEKNKARK